MSETVLVALADATSATCGSKAGALGALLRAGLPVPDGVVVPAAVHRDLVRDLARRLGDDADGESVRAAVADGPLPAPVATALRRVLAELGDHPVAVRSSASDEDTGEVSAAGRYETVLGVRGATDVAAAVRTCWASLHAARARAYVDHRPADELADDRSMAVIVQRHLDAEVAGVLFTPPGPDAPTVIEASWGLGPSVVAGTVTPDTYRVHRDGTVASVVADKATRVDRAGAGVLASEVPADRRGRPALDDATATGLAALGAEVAATLGGPRDVACGVAWDIEWAVAEGRLWVLQARPITAALPAPAAPPAPPAPAASVARPRDGRPRVPVTLEGVPGSVGIAIGATRIVRGPADFAQVRPGDILVCPFTDPAWTPLLRVAAGVITETGGALSHAAIVAREQRIPAVLGVAGAMSAIADGVIVTIDGAAGTVVTTSVGPTPHAS